VYDSTAAYGRKGRLDYEYNVTSNTDRLIKYYRYKTTLGGKDYLDYTLHRLYEGGRYTDHTTRYDMDNTYGRPTGMRYGGTTDDLRIQYDYSRQGYLTRIKNAVSGYVYREVTDQDARGNTVGALFGNGLMTQSQTYHPATGQMTWNRVTKGGTTKVHTLAYDYGAFSNLYQSVVTTSTGQDNYETYTYDALHRLTQSVRAFSNGNPNHVVKTAYNVLGNITKKDDYANTYYYGNLARNLGGNAGPNAVRRIDKKSGGNTSYSYDNNGNMLTGD